MSLFKKSIKNYILILSLFMAAGVSVAHAEEVDQEVEKLVLHSIRLELSHNLSLRDPQDNLPLEIDESQLNIFGVSVVLSPEDGSANYDYKVEVPYETVDGETGNLLCTVPLVDLNGVMSVKKADCFIENVPVVETTTRYYQETYSIHEIFQMMGGRF